MVKLYVEGGGGEAAGLKIACREGFTSFLTKVGITRKPRVVACGTRKNAYDSFRTAIANGDDAILLVDSEAPVACEHQRGKPEEWLPWRHLKQLEGDGWDKPVGSKETDCHLMVQCMENWFVADRRMLESFFGQGLRLSALPATQKIEDIGKAKAQKSLETATQACKTQKPYGKGENSFKLLAKVDPEEVISRSPWAKRFVDVMKDKCAKP